MGLHPHWLAKMNSLLDRFTFDGHWHRYETPNISIKLSIGDIFYIFYIEARQNGRQFVYCDDSYEKTVNVLENLITYESI
jgi:hypothetical protein